MVVKGMLEAMLTTLALTQLKRLWRVCAGQ